MKGDVRAARAEAGTSGLLDVAGRGREHDRAAGVAHDGTVALPDAGARKLQQALAKAYAARQAQLTTGFEAHIAAVVRFKRDVAVDTQLAQGLDLHNATTQHRHRTGVQAQIAHGLHVDHRAQSSLGGQLHAVHVQAQCSVGGAQVARAIDVGQIARNELG